VRSRTSNPSGETFFLPEKSVGFCRFLLPFPSVANSISFFHPARLCVCRAQSGMPGWLQFLTTIAQPHYTSTALHQALLSNSIAAPHNATVACPVFNSPECRFKDGTDFYTERLGHDIGYSQAVAFLFPLAGFIFNLILYSLPLPEYIKQKHRE
jgi:hypothetical protein